MFNKNFIIKIVVFAVLFIAIDIFCGWSFGRWRVYLTEYCPDGESVQFYSYVEHHTDDVIIIGSSDARCNYNPHTLSDSLGMSVYNCGLHGLSLEWQCCLINMILNRYNPKVIIWAQEPNELSFDYSDFEQYFANYWFNPYYDDNPMVKQVIDSKDPYERFRMLSKSYRVNSLLTQYAYYSFNKKTITDFGYENRKESHHVKMVSSFEPDTIIQHRADDIRQVYERCKEHGVKVVVAIHPFYKTNDIRESIQYAEIFRLAEEYNMPVIDHYDLFGDDNSYFDNWDHLCTKGVDAYMNVFIPELKEAIK